MVQVAGFSFKKLNINILKLQKKSKSCDLIILPVRYILKHILNNELNKKIKNKQVLSHVFSPPLFYTVQIIK